MNEQRIKGADVLDTEPIALNGVPFAPVVPFNDPDASPPIGEDDAALDQVERILRSEELRSCEGLRRLFRFLATKSLYGEADELKEYIVAIDGLGKPSTYDPRQNSAVRIQVGRLRQKLADYYRKEGQFDPVIVEMPKGRFKLKFEYRNGAGPRPAHEPIPAAGPTLVPGKQNEKSGLWAALVRIRFAASLAAALIIGIVIGSTLYRLWPARTKTSSSPAANGWTADMENLWQPFIATRRPLIVAIEDPLFVELQGSPGVYYRDKELNDWNSVLDSPSMTAVRRALKSSLFQPSRYYTSYGEVEASFLVAKLLGPRVQNLTVVRTSNLSLQQLADNNVLFIGVQNLFFTEQAQATPIDAPLQPVREGIRNLHPGPTEPSLFLDQYTTAPSEEGIVYALVTHFPGPLGSNDVESFTSNRSAGYVAAVKTFVSPDFVGPLVEKLKQACGGRMPPYYQVLLKVKFKDEVPTEITYVLARELHYHGGS